MLLSPWEVEPRECDMATVANILDNAAVYMDQPNSTSFIINGFDAGLWAINAARRVAERSHDFTYSQLDVFLSIGTAGGDLTNAYVNTSVTIAGTLSPNVAGAFALTGIYNGLPFYTRTVSSVVYFLSFSGTSWTITAGGFTLGSNYWIWTLTNGDINPAGLGNSYTAVGANTGTATATAATGTIIVKRVQMVLLPIASGGYEPIEMKTNDEYLGWVRRQIGRQNFDPTKNISSLGVTFLNPFAYQNGQTIFVTGGVTLPILAKLNIVRFMPDYTRVAGNSDFFTQYGAEYLQWATIIELNKYYKQFATRQEGNIDEPEVQTYANNALGALIAWDNSISKSTTTPTAS